MITLKLDMHADAVPVPSPLSEYIVSETSAKSESTLSAFTNALLRYESVYIYGNSIVTHVENSSPCGCKSTILPRIGPRYPPGWDPKISCSCNSVMLTSISSSRASAGKSIDMLLPPLIDGNPESIKVRVLAEIFCTFVVALKNREHPASATCPGMAGS